MEDRSTPKIIRRTTYESATNTETTNSRGIRTTRKQKELTVDCERLETIFGFFFPSELRRVLVDKLQVNGVDHDRPQCLKEGCDKELRTKRKVDKNTSKHTMINLMIAQVLNEKNSPIPKQSTIKFENVWKECIENSVPDPVNPKEHRCASQSHIGYLIRDVIDEYIENDFYIGIDQDAFYMQFVVAIGKATSQAKNTEKNAFSSRWRTRYYKAGYTHMRRLYTYILRDTRDYRSEEDVALNYEKMAQKHLNYRFSKLMSHPATSEKDEVDRQRHIYDIEYMSNQDGMRWKGPPVPGSGIFLYLAIRAVPHATIDDDYSDGERHDGGDADEETEQEESSERF